MQNNYKKECYDQNPHFKIHHSHGNYKSDLAINYLHYDKELIIEYFKNGQTSIKIEGNVYTVNDGDILITSPEELHFSTTKDGVFIEKISIHVNETLLSIFGGDRTVFFDKIVDKKKGVGNLINAETVKKFELDKTFNQCLTFAKNRSMESQVLLTCKIVEVLSIISKLIATDDNKKLSPTNGNEPVNLMIDYINKHYNEDITLEKLAEKFHFSKYYISHLFKDYAGVSPYDYLIIRRLYNFNDLVRGKTSISEACFLVGFNNYSNFFRLYKKHFKITPQQFKNSLDS